MKNLLLSSISFLFFLLSAAKTNAQTQLVNHSGCTITITADNGRTLTIQNGETLSDSLCTGTQHWTIGDGSHSSTIPLIWEGYVPLCADNLEAEVHAGLG